MGTGSTEKSRTGGLSTKTTSVKSNNVTTSGTKKHYSNTVIGKAATTSSLGDKRSAALNFGKNNNSASSSGTNKSSNIEIKSSSPYSGKSAKSIFGDTAGSSKSNKITNSITPPTIEKNYVSPSSANSKNKKSIMTFGIIWLPTRKRNKLKDAVYNPYDNDKRDRYKERTPSMYNFTSGDSSNHQVFIKKEEESHLLADKLKVPVGAAAMTSDGLPVDITYVDNSSEQQETIDQNNDDMKEAAGDSLVKNDNEDYLESKESLNKAPDSTDDKQENCDKVDSGLLRIPSPPDKLWKSNVSTSEEEDCDITCMYYTLQCCDCVIT